MLPSWVLASSKNLVSAKRLNPWPWRSSPLSHRKRKSSNHYHHGHIRSLYRKTSEHRWYLCWMGLQCLPSWNTHRTLCWWSHWFWKDCALCHWIKPTENEGNLYKAGCSSGERRSQEILCSWILLGSLESI